MTRPHSGKKIGLHLESTFFKPTDVPASAFRIRIVHLDKLEAMRLVAGEALLLQQSSAPLRPRDAVERQAPGWWRGHQGRGHAQD
jgi:predicted DNA-binding protein (UPF0251 family)